ncbi:HD domain-containing phosphohydrolase [Dechloromonas sp. ZY10]|uniref:HD domain-containing phosphohydrolase n=1 Tax=Dechloromonas aquae TaxID=2664436 RepID=UPI00352983D1
MTTQPSTACARHIVYALSDALDLVGIDDIAHGKRVGIMAAECARHLGWPDWRIERIFDLGLLHDIGVSSTATHRQLVSEFDWTSSQQHCEIGYRLLREYPPLADLAEPILYHHTHWPALPAGLPQETAEAANLIYLVDRVDALAAPFHAEGTLLRHTVSIREQVCQHAAGRFSPTLLAAFLAASRPEAFWLTLEPRGIRVYLGSMLSATAEQPVPAAELKPVARILSQIVDAKSPFTAEHSQGVAALARLLGEQCGITGVNLDKIEIAGLLHDIGKLRVPDEILDKPGQLDHDERQVMNAHSFETWQILRQIPGCEEIAPWAAYHHEEPGGHGYPFHLDATTLPLEARILRVADIFQAMTQNRPYRRGLDLTSAAAFMRELVASGRLDGALVERLLDIPEAALAAARAAPSD